MPLKAAFQRLMKNQKGFRKPMLEAILAGDLKKIDALIKDGADVNAHFTDGVKVGTTSYGALAQNYALFAAYNEKFDVFLHLKKNGCDVNQIMPSGYTLLTAYCTFKRHSFIQPEHITSLLRLGVEAAKTDGRGQNAVHVLSYQDIPDEYNKHDTTADNSQLIDVLLNAGVDIDAQDNDGNTALHHTVAGVSPVGDIKFLLERDANATLKNNQGQTAIDVALANPEELNDPTPMLQEYVDRKAAEIATARVVTTAQGLTPEAAAMLNTEAPVITFKTQRVTLKL